jgi:N-acylneuraminate cytidylyltransferase
LLSHSVAQAVESEQFDVVAVSSDSAEYLEIGRDAGATLCIERPTRLAADETAKPPVLAHAMEAAEAFAGRQAEMVVDLQPTSPLRRPEDIAGAITTLAARHDLLNVVSVTEAKASPYYTLVEETTEGYARLSKPPPSAFGRRQDIPRSYALNGSIYVWRRQAVADLLPALTPRTGLWVMPDICAFDIDTALDFEIAAFVAHRHFGWPETPL